MAYLCLLARSGFLHNSLATFVLVWNLDCRYGTVNAVVCVAAADCCVCLLAEHEVGGECKGIGTKEGGDSKPDGTCLASAPGV